MLFLLQEGPAETSAYMIAGYIVIFGIMLIYLASLAIRKRNLRQDLDLLHDLEEKDRSGEPFHPGDTKSTEKNILNT